MVVLNEREYAEELLQKDVTCRTAGHALHYIAKLYCNLLVFLVYSCQEIFPCHVLCLQLSKIFRFYHIGQGMYF